MRWMKMPKLQWYSFLFSMPLIGLAMNLILFENRMWEDSGVWFISFPFIYVLGFISWYTHFAYSKFVEKQYPELNQTTQRILLKLLSLLFIMPPGIALLLFLYDRLHILGYNFQMIHLVTASNRVGLDNIKAKYDLLRQGGYQVIEDEKNFTVVLPLIWKGNAVTHQTAAK